MKWSLNMEITKDFFIIPPLNESISRNIYPKAKKPKNISSYFDSLKPLSRKKITKIIKELYS